MQPFRRLAPNPDDEHALGHGVEGAGMADTSFASDPADGVHDVV